MKKSRAERAPSQRQLRVGEEMRHTLSAILSRGDLRDPDLQDVSITVGEVRVSHDLRTATAFVLPLGGQDGQAVLEALRRATPFIRGQIGKAMRLKFTPTLKFEYDGSFDHAEHIARLLDDARPADRPPESDDGT